VAAQPSFAAARREEGLGRPAQSQPVQCNSVFGPASIFRPTENRGRQNFTWGASRFAGSSSSNSAAAWKAKKLATKLLGNVSRAVL